MRFILFGVAMAKSMHFVPPMHVQSKIFSSLELSIQQNKLHDLFDAMF